jgi:hypothetical protein
MSEAEFRYSFRILGPTRGRRLLVDADAALDAYRRCDARARADEESYVGVFRFGEDFATHLARVRSTAGFAGRTWATHVWLDIDRLPEQGGVARAISDSQRLVATLEERYLVPVEALAPFISGGKGCHIGLPTTLWSPAGGEGFHEVTREFATRIAAAADVMIDKSIYDRVRAFRAPNSRHPKTGLHKRFVPPQQFGLLSLDDAMRLAASPAPFEWPDLTGESKLPSLVAEWQAATEAVAARRAAMDDRLRAIADGTEAVRVNRLTLDLIRGERVEVGDRHRVIYSAARNLAEAGAPRHLVVGLLREAALDTGLPPREVDRQLECGFLAAAAGASQAPGSQDDEPPAATRPN